MFGEEGIPMQASIDYEQLVSAIGDAVIISDANGAITLWNPAANACSATRRPKPWASRWT